jgi:hypothetical protein
LASNIRTSYSTEKAVPHARQSGFQAILPQAPTSVNQTHFPWLLTFFAKSAVTQCASTVSEKTAPTKIFR